MSVQFAESGGSGKPSGVDLAAFANRAKEIDIGGDDLVDLGDDLGIGLIANTNKISPSPRGNAAPSRQVNVGGGGGGGDIPRIQINPVDDLEVVNLDAGPGASDIRITRDGGGFAESAPFVINAGGGGSAPHEYDGFDASAPVKTGSGLSAEEETRLKQNYLTKLQRLENGGIKGQRMTMSNSLEDIKAEHDKLTDSRNLEASLRFQRNALMTFVTGVEMVNDKFGNRLPVKPRLKGWSESVHTNIEDFDEIFEELYDLYKDKAKMHPMMRLVGTLGVSATMYHLTNSMAEKSGVPGMSDLLNENPELQRQFAQAMAAKMGGGLGNFMSAASGFGGPPGGGGGGGPMPAPMGYGAPPPTPPRAAPTNTRVPFNSAAAAQESGPRVRREMRGPNGVDDILKAFETERLMQQASNPVATQHAGVFTPAGPPPTPPSRVSILREGVGTMADPMADFIIGGDGESIGSGSTMNTDRRRGRRRAVATPVGATLDLNV
jgi:hypothetical protein